MSSVHVTMLNLAQLRENLNLLMDPRVLKLLADFLEATGNEDKSMLERYKWFLENGEDGEDCRYAVMAKEFFLKDQATEAALAICKLYHQWAASYEKP